MIRKATVVKTVSTLGIAGMLLAGCGGSGSDLPPDGATGDSDGGDSADLSTAKMMDWKGCDALDDLNPVREYMGVTALDSELINAAIGEGLDAEAATCSGLFDLATYSKSVGSVDSAITGDASIMAGVVPWSTEEDASQNFQDRLADREENLSGIGYSNEQEGELGGEWDESYYIGADGGSNRYYINAYGRYGSWILYISVDFLHDPAVRDGADPVYPFTEEEILDWIANEYMPQTQADILEKIESE
ncbi:hypothetical protein [Glycomyces tarimensis]